MRGRLFATVAVVSLAVVPAAATKSAKTTTFRVMSAKATATLVFHTIESTNAGADGTIKLAVLQRARGTGRVPGRALVRLKGTLSERVKMRQRVSETSPYQEQVCSNTRKISSRGGLVLKRVGSKIQATWAFPQARPSFCRGPFVKAVMKRLYPASVFNRHSVSIVLSGTKSVEATGMNATYRWRAVVKLTRS